MVFLYYGGDIETEHYLFPTIAIRHRINDKMVLGTGLQVVSGLGSDYRNSHPLGPTVTFLTFGANVAGAYDITPQTSIGASATLAYSLLEIGLNTGTAPQETFGFRGGLGITHDLGPVMVSANYSSEMRLNYHDITRDTLTTWEDLEVEQPQEFVVGIASTPAMWEDLLIEANVIYKNWDNAELYQDIWQDTTTFQLGAQYKVNPTIKLRAGYSYTSDHKKEGTLGNNVGNLTSLGVPGIGTFPISPALIQLIQSTLAGLFWNHNVTAGVGIKLTDTVSADFHVGYGWGEDQTLGANQIDAAIFQGGAGFSWKF